MFLYQLGHLGVELALPEVENVVLKLRNQERYVLHYLNLKLNAPEKHIPCTIHRTKRLEEAQ